VISIDSKRVSVKCGVKWTVFKYSVIRILCKCFESRNVRRVFPIVFLYLCDRGECPCRVRSLSHASESPGV
jgi:hypothetical protein